jgi:hypothetical protein
MMLNNRIDGAGQRASYDASNAITAPADAERLGTPSKLEVIPSTMREPCDDDH